MDLVMKILKKVFSKREIKSAGLRLKKNHNFFIDIRFSSYLKIKIF
tara:strand:- start:39 stop:176 length:138 start_codon:yes stop_codon:yes gene_type:complete